MKTWRVVAGVVLLLTGFILFGEAAAGPSAMLPVLLAMAGATTGIFVLCGRHIARALLITALVLPLGGTILPWLWGVAGGCAVVALLILGVARAKRSYPAADLPTVGDDAPFIEVEERTFGHRSRRTLVTVTTAIPAAGVVAGLIVGQPAVAITAGCMLFTMAVIWLLSSPPGYRVDADGFSGTFLFVGERTVRWRDVTALQTWQHRGPRYSKHLLHIVHTSNGTLRFYSDIKDADELLRIIAGATGLTWP